MTYDLQTQANEAAITFQFSEEAEYDGVVTTIIKILLDGQTIGLSECRKRDKNWHIGNIEIAEKYAGKDLYGKILIEKTRDTLWLKDKIAITVDPIPQKLWISKEELERFYLKNGFIKSGAGTQMKLDP